MPSNSKGKKTKINTKKNFVLKRNTRIVKIQSSKKNHIFFFHSVEELTVNGEESPAMNELERVTGYENKKKKKRCRLQNQSVETALHCQ